MKLVELLEIAKICKGEVLEAEVTLINVERDTLTITIDYEF